MSGADDDGCAGPRLVVIGGGITGLSAAWQGAARGARVTVLEASGRFGGKIVTERRDGFVIEGGPDSYVAYRPALARLLDELGIADEVIAPGGGRRAALLARGALRPMPAGMGMVLPTRLWPFVTTRVLGWPDKLRAGLDLVIPRRLRDGRDVSIGAFLRSRLGDGIVDRYAEVMVGGIYGARVDELSLDAVLPSLRRNEREHRSLMVASLAQGRAARRGRATARGAVGSPFRTLRAGLGRVVEALVEVSGGIPFVLHKVAGTLDQRHRKVIGPAEVRECFEDFIDDPDEFCWFEHYLTRVGPHYGERAILAERMLRATLSETNDWIPVDTLPPDDGADEILEDLTKDHYLERRGRSVRWRYPALQYIWARKKGEWDRR